MIRLKPWLTKAAVTLASLSIGYVGLSDAQQIDHASTSSVSALTSKTITSNGHIAHVYGMAVNGTTYMPVWYVMQALTSLGFTNTWNGSTWNFQVPTTSAIDWSNLQSGSGNASLLLNGTLVHKVISVVHTDPNSGHPTTYMPVWYVMQMMARAGIACAWNGTTWTIVPNQLPPNAPTGPWNIAFITNDASSLSDAETVRNNVNVCIPNGFDVTPEDGLTSDQVTGITPVAHAHGQLSLARVTLMNGNQLASLFANSQATATLEDDIANAIVADGYDGVNIDFEFLPAADREAFVSFLQQLHVLLASQGKLLTVDLPAIADPAKEPWNAGYDYTAIGETVDKVILMSYDYSYPTGSPGPIAPLWWVNETVQYAITQMPPDKVILGLDTYAYDWSGTGEAKAYSLTQADTLSSQPNATDTWDTLDQAPTFTYTLNGVNHTVYYENAESITPRIALAKQYQLGGISDWRSGLEDTATAQILNSYP